MNDQTLINILFGAISAAYGWYAREMWSTMKELHKDLASLRESLPKEYVTKVDFRDSFREVKDLLEAIRDKLDTKADK